MIRILKTARREYWVQFDRSAGVWEMFASPEGADYLGAFDARAAAKAYAIRHASEA